MKPSQFVSSPRRGREVLTNLHGVLAAIASLMQQKRGCDDFTASPSRFLHKIFVEHFRRFLRETRARSSKLHGGKCGAP